MLRNIALWILLTSSCFSFALRVRDNIYINLEDGFPCTRFLNSTHQIGCHSPKGGNVGIVFWTRTAADFQYIVDDAFNLAPYIIVTHVRLFGQINAEVLKNLRPNLSGVIIYFEEGADIVEVPAYSEDHKCPSSTHDLYAKDSTYGQCRMAAWNKPGDGARFFDWNVPIYLLVNKTEINLITQECYLHHNEGYDGEKKRFPLCAAELVTFNHAAGDAVRCMRRNTLTKFLTAGSFFCVPLEDLNVFIILPFRERGRPFTEKSIFILAARMDSLSLFNEYTPGTTSVGSVIVWLAIAEALGRSTKLIEQLSNKTGRHLMPILFHGEAFDYIGSSRMVWDMQTNTFPSYHGLNSSFVNLSHIGFFFELSHVTNMDNRELYLHVDPIAYENYSRTREEINNLHTILLNTFPSIKNSNFNLPLPPSSLQSFLRSDRSIPGAVIGDYLQEFSSRFYNSFMDIPLGVRIPEFKSNAIALGNAALDVMFRWLNKQSSVPDVPTINETVVASLTECLMSWPAWNCTIFERIIDSVAEEERTLFSKQLNENSRARTYIHLRSNRPSMVRVFASYLTEYFLGTKNCSNQTTRGSCVDSKNTSCFYMKDVFAHKEDVPGCCVCSVAMYSSAKSPAFDIEKHDLLTSNYSTWVESVYSITTMRLFLVTSSHWQLTILLSGIGIFLFWLTVVWLIVQHSNKLFETAAKNEDRRQASLAVAACNS
uniref:Nicastrin n=1 Tax=Trichuris muris TaxID=70415 RepID=A0A5S6QUR6_TRIMR